jgi:hypothetical protein
MQRWVPLEKYLGRPGHYHITRRYLFSRRKKKIVTAICKSLPCAESQPRGVDNVMWRHRWSWPLVGLSPPARRYALVFSRSARGTTGGTDTHGHDPAPHKCAHMLRTPRLVSKQTILFYLGQWKIAPVKDKHRIDRWIFRPMLCSFAVGHRSPLTRWTLARARLRSASC